MSETDIKKVLHVTFNMAIGGTEQVICQIVENSDVNKFSHEILCIDGNVGALGLGLQDEGYYVVSTKRKKGLDLNLTKFIHKFVIERNVAVLHCHQYTPYFYGALGSLGTKAKLIFTEHGRFYPDRHHFKRRFINPLLALRTHCITAISESTADAVSKYEYFSREHITVIYNGIKGFDDLVCTKEDLLNELRLSPKFRYIGTIARLEPIKNQTMMIEAFYKVKQQVPGIKLVLIGDGVKRMDLEQLSKSLGIEDDVIFTGYLDNPQKYLKLFEIFLLSSFSEGTSMTLLEAMSLSRPCVVTQVGGNSEIVSDNVTGLVVPSCDEKAFAEAIVQLLNNFNQRDGFGKKAREKFLNNFMVSKMIDSYQDLYLD